MRLVGGLIFLCVMPASGFAQGMSEPVHLSGTPASLVSSPVLRRVFVQASSGEELAGQLLSLDPTSLTLLIDARTVAMPLEQVRRIQMSGDSLVDGARRGALVLGLWCALVCGQGVDRPEQWMQAIAINGAVGAALGVVFDAAVSGRTTIYDRSRHQSKVSEGRPSAVFRIRF